MEQRPFLIAGGGIAGLAASLGLARIGQPSRVFEQAAEFSEVGAGLQMSPNAVSALRWLGAWDAVEPQCVIPTEIHVRDGYSDRLLQRVRLGKGFEKRFRAPYRVVHRADLLGGLLATARARNEVELCLSSQVVSAESTADGASVTLASGGAEGEAVIGADGIRSQLRREIAGVIEPVYRGHTIFRALIPLQDVPSGIAADCVTLWLYPGGHVVHYAVSNWRQFNIVSTLDSPWQSSGWNEPGTPDELRGGFENAVPALADVLATPKTWLKWAGADCEPFDTWTQGRIALVGDAAHATLPFLAQGAAMALEDACVLANELAGEFPVPAALARYAGRRRGRTARIQLASRRLAEIYHAQGLRRFCRNLAMTVMPSHSFLASLHWIYDWDVMQQPD